MSEFKRRYLGELPQQMQANLATLEALNTQLRLNSDNQVRAMERRQALAAQLAEAESFAAGARGRRAAPRRPGAAGASPRAAQAGADRGPDPLHRRAPDRDPAQGGDRRRRARSGAPPSPRRSPRRRPRRRLPPSPYVLRLRESLHTAESELKILKAEDQRLRSAIAAYQARVENTPKREQEFQDISRDYDSTREAHQSLVKRYEEAQLAESMEQRQKGEQFRILDPALPSTVTAAPNRLRLLMMALRALGSASRAGVAMLAEMLDTSFHSADELRAFTTVPVLVSIARIATEADLRRRRLRFRLVGGGGAAGRGPRRRRLLLRRARQRAASPHARAR